MAQGGLVDLIANWQQVGIFDVILPLLLIFAITYGILQKVKIFGAESKNINVIVSLALSILFLQNQYLNFVLQRAAPRLSIAMVAFLMLLLLFGIFGGEHKAWTQGALLTAFIVSILMVIWAFSADIFGAPGEGFGSWLSNFWYGMDPTLKSTLIFIIVIVVVISVVTSEGKKKPMSFLEGLRGKEGKE